MNQLNENEEATVFPTVELLLTKQDVCRILRQSLATIDRKIRLKEIRVVRLGSAVRVDPVDLRAYIERNREPEFVGKSDGTHCTSGKVNEVMVTSK